MHSIYPGTRKLLPASFLIGFKVRKKLARLPQIDIGNPFFTVTRFDESYSLIPRAWLMRKG